jgi:hypothetical protein
MSLRTRKGEAIFNLSGELFFQTNSSMPARRLLQSEQNILLRNDSQALRHWTPTKKQPEIMFNQHKAAWQ